MPKTEFNFIVRKNNINGCEIENEMNHISPRGFASMIIVLIFLIGGISAAGNANSNTGNSLNNMVMHFPSTSKKSYYISFNETYFYGCI